MWGILRSLRIIISTLVQKGPHCSRVDLTHSLKTTMLINHVSTQYIVTVHNGAAQTCFYHWMCRQAKHRCGNPSPRRRAGQIKAEFRLSLTHTPSVPSFPLLWSLPVGLHVITNIWPSPGRADSRVTLNPALPFGAPQPLSPIGQEQEPEHPPPFSPSSQPPPARLPGSPRGLSSCQPA